jgi:hypothetical protein
MTGLLSLPRNQGSLLRGGGGFLLAFLLLPGLVSPVSPAAGTGTGVSLVATFSLAAQVPEESAGLRSAVEGLAQAWARGNADGVANHFARGGLSLKLDGPVRASVAPRQASAALRDFFRSYEGGEIQVVRAAPLAGTPDRGFAEIRWSAPVSGTSQSVQRSLFLGLVFDGETWRVDELRLLP